MTRDILRARQDAANGRRERHGVFAIGPTAASEREGERETTLLPGTVQLGYTCMRVRERALVLFDFCRRAATLSRRLARATFYSLLPSRAGCAPLPSFPRVSFARTRTLRLFHFICFASYSLLCASQSHSLLSPFFFLFFFGAFIPPLPPLSPFLAYSPFCDILSPRSFFPSVPLSTAVFFGPLAFLRRTRGPLVVSVFFSRSPQI